MQARAVFKYRVPRVQAKALDPSIAINLSLITLGCIIYSLGMNSVLVPNRWLAGGIAGLAIMLHYWLTSLDVGVAYFILNLPLLALGWFHVSRRFMLYTIFGMLCFSITASWIHPPVAQIHNPILAVLFAGVICGIGGGLILRSLGSAGGLDVIGIYLSQRFGFRPGTVILAGNAGLLLLGIFLFGLENILYSIAFLYISAKVIDAILTGLNQRKSLLIISEHSQAISQAILSEIHRGVTFLKGEGAYSGKERAVIFTITTLTELPKLKELIFSIDPHAFVVVNDTLEVLGQRHGKLKVY